MAGAILIFLTVIAPTLTVYQYLWGQDHYLFAKEHIVKIDDEIYTFRSNAKGRKNIWEDLMSNIASCNMPYIDSYNCTIDGWNYLKECEAKVFNVIK